MTKSETRFSRNAEHDYIPTVLRLQRAEQNRLWLMSMYAQLESAGASRVELTPIVVFLAFSIE